MDVMPHPRGVVWTAWCARKHPNLPGGWRTLKAGRAFRSGEAVAIGRQAHLGAGCVWRLRGKHYMARLLGPA